MSTHSVITPARHRAAGAAVDADLNQPLTPPDVAVLGAKAGHEPLTLLMIEVDHFKSTNDVHGHQQDDLVLSQLARRLVASIRPDDLLSRIGGEEVLVLKPGFDPTTGDGQPSD